MCLCILVLLLKQLISVWKHNYFYDKFSAYLPLSILLFYIGGRKGIYTHAVTETGTLKESFNWELLCHISIVHMHTLIHWELLKILININTWSLHLATSHVECRAEQQLTRFVASWSTWHVIQTCLSIIPCNSLVESARDSYIKISATYTSHYACRSSVTTITSLLILAYES